ncbi:hypothetical protein SBDP1_40006 [Syntrophobacter sp. SbD1]|nr:hypothetical protein SBDP1_40006 [Syntrophobacter sp. SbD1]
MLSNCAPPLDWLPPPDERARELAGGIFSAPNVAKTLGIKPGRLKEWLKYIPPNVEKAKGPGTRNLFTRTDIYKLYAFKELIESGRLERGAAAEIVSKLESWGLKYSATLLGSLPEVKLAHTGDFLKIGLTFNIDALKKEVDGLLG